MSGIDIGDIPVPPGTEKEVRIVDRFDHDVAFKFAFIGVGQCGGRIAATFSKLGYGRVAAVNSTRADLGDLALPEAQKLDVGEARGAGKDPQTAAAIFADKDEDLFDLYKRCWGDDVDVAFVCFAAAGGTGAGAFPKAVEVARRYMLETKRQVRVGAIVALPKTAEGQRFAKNAVHAMRHLVSQQISPILFVDNEKIKELFDPGTDKEHDVANTGTARLLHTFNRIAGAESEHTTFDRADFARLLDSGVVAVGSDRLTSWDSPADITTAIRDKLRHNILATVDLNQGTVAALIYVLYGDAYGVRSSYLDYGTEMLTRMLADDSVVLPGVYRGIQDGQAAINILAMIGGLPWPRKRLEELGQKAGTPKDNIAKILGV